MIVGSIKENTTLEKRVSITPESAKNIIALGLKVYIEKGYALHLGINDEEYKNVGVEIKNSSEILSSSNLITKVNNIIETPQLPTRELIMLNNIISG